MTRRDLLASSAALAAASALASPRTRMTIHLSCGSIGVKADQRQALEYAHRFGYESIDADSAFLASLDESALKDFLDGMRSKKVGWGTSGVPTEFRKDDAAFRASITQLPPRAKALQNAGVTRVTTWISPGSNDLTYLENFRQHAARLREIASVLGDHGARLGLEYVGPKTSWTRSRYPFVKSMREMKELIAEIGRPNVGFVLDSWHWYTAGESAADLKTLTAKDVVSIDLNDAPAGLALDQQKDNERELPLATGVIDLAAFLNTLNSIGCDAPARCEPFNAPLRAMPPEQALQTTIDAMKKSFALIQ